MFMIAGCPHQTPAVRPLPVAIHPVGVPARLEIDLLRNIIYNDPGKPDFLSQHKPSRLMSHEADLSATIACEKGANTGMEHSSGSSK